MHLWRSSLTLGQQENVNTILKTTGYRLRVSEAASEYTPESESLNVNLKWVNSGVAPFYFDWEIKTELIDSSGVTVAETISNPVISQCLPGNDYLQSLKLDISDVPTGSLNQYKLAVSIIDPNTGNPGLNLANTTETSAGSKRYIVLENITINP